MKELKARYKKQVKEKIASAVKLIDGDSCYYFLIGKDSSKALAVLNRNKEMIICLKRGAIIKYIPKREGGYEWFYPKYWDRERWYVPASDAVFVEYLGDVYKTDGTIAIKEEDASLSSVPYDSDNPPYFYVKNGAFVILMIKQAYIQ